MIYIKISNNNFLFRLKILFEGLFKDVKNSLDYRNLGNFGKNLKEFSNEIQGLL